MGSLRGDVALIGLATLFQTIAELHREGTLTVTSQGRKKIIHFAPDGLRLFASSERRFRLGDILVRRRLITIDHLTHALQEQKHTNERLGVILVQQGAIPAEILDGVVRTQAEEEIFDMLFWSDGIFVFMEGAPVLDPAGEMADPIQLQINVGFLALESARRLDEWAQVEAMIPSLDRIITLTDQGQEFARSTLSGDDTLACLVPQLDGHHTIQKIIDDTGLTRFQVCQTIFALMNEGLAKESKPDSTPLSAQTGHSTTFIKKHKAIPFSKPSATPTGASLLPPAPATIPPTETAPLTPTAPTAVDFSPVATPPPAPSTPSAEPSGVKSILLIDDEGYYRKITRFHLERAGFKVIEAVSAQRALDMIKIFKIHAVISEISLPDRDGFTICRAMRTIPKTRQTPFIFVTGHNRREYIRMAKEAGGNAYIVKPFAPDVLIERLCALLGPTASVPGANAPSPA